MRVAMPHACRYLIVLDRYDARPSLQDYEVEFYSRPATENSSHYIVARHRRHPPFTGPHQSQTFHLIWTTPLAAFQEWRWTVLRRIRGLHPWARIVVHSDTLHAHGAAAQHVDHFMPINATLFAGSPLAPWWAAMEASYIDLYSGRSPAEGQNFYSHVSDAIRLAVLYRHGGTYLDFDMLVLRSLYGFRNALGQEHPTDGYQLNFAAAVFDRGHPFLWALMMRFRQAYKKDCWVCVGPSLVSRVGAQWEALGLAVREPAPLPSRPRALMVPWHRVHIYPPATFYPIFYSDVHGGVNNASHAAQYAAATANSSVVHVWTKMGWSLDKAQAGSFLHSLFASVLRRLRRLL